MGEEICDAKKIAKHYFFSSTFWIDVVAILSNPLTDGVQAIQFVGILKMNRVFRIKKIITQANLQKSIKASLKIIFFTFILFVYIHLTACIWFYIVDIKQTWIPPFDFIDYTQSDLFSKETPVNQKYWVSVYYCTLVLGGNELGPSQVAELFYVVIINLLGAIVNA